MSTATQSARPATTARQGEGRNLTVLGMPHFFKVTGDQNDAGTSVMEVIVAPGQGVPWHTHTRKDEFFCVLQGELVCQMDGLEQPVTLKAGDFLFLPRHRPHSFINASTSQARMLVTVTPGTGTDRMFAELEQAGRRISDPQALFPEVGRISPGMESPSRRRREFVLDP